MVRPLRVTAAQPTPYGCGRDAKRGLFRGRVRRGHKACPRERPGHRQALLQPGSKLKERTPDRRELREVEVRPGLRAAVLGSRTSTRSCSDATASSPRCRSGSRASRRPTRVARPEIVAVGAGPWRPNLKMGARPRLNSVAEESRPDPRAVGHLRRRRDDLLAGGRGGPGRDAGLRGRGRRRRFFSRDWRSVGTWRRSWKN